MGRTRNIVLFPATTATATGATKTPHNRPMVFTAEGTTSSGAGSATIVIEGLVGTGTIWTLIDTLALTLGVTATVDSGTTDVPWEFVRARITAISGTGASVQAWLACEATW